MKRIILVLLLLSGFCAIATAQTNQAQTVPTSHAKLSPTTRQFLFDWKDCQAVAHIVQTKATQGTAAKAPTDARISKLQDLFGVQLLPTAHANTGVNKGNSNHQVNTYAFYVPVFVEFDSEEALQQAARHGLVVQSKLKTMATALVLPDSIEAVAKITHIRRISVANKVQTNLDSARKYTFTNQVHQGGIRYGQALDKESNPYKGEGVVVGIVDVGFDFTHPTFFDAENPSVYRVKRVWDQRTTASGSLKPPTGYSKGVEYTTQEQILAAQHCAGTGSHGSHVAGIAGGSGAGSPYTGMAPKSDLVFVPSTLYSADILDGVKYILDYAKSQKKPCVINLSLGSHLGPHDGTSDFDRACDELKQNGFVLVGSAGNEGSDALYLQHTFTGGSDDTTMSSFIEFSTTTTLDIWSDNSDNFIASLRLINPVADVQSSITWASNSTQYGYRYLVVGKDTLCKVWCYPELNETNNKAHICFSIDAEKWDRTKYKDYKLEIKLISINKTKTMSTQMWLNNGEFSNGGYTNNARIKTGSTSHTVGETGGTGKSIITVGAYESRLSWTDITGGGPWVYNSHKWGQIAGFSSHGPTADGRMKPDIASPGCILASAYNSFDNSHSDQMKIQTIQKNGKDYHFGMMQGTSMASPAAAGIIALWLQVDSTLDVDDVKQILDATAMTHPDAGKPNAEYTWGRGKIDAKAGVQYLLDKTPLLVYTGDSSQITDTSVTLRLTHTIRKGIGFGFYYHTAANVTEGRSVAACSDNQSETCSVSIIKLQPGQTYYYKAFGYQASNGKNDTVWGEVKSFKTLTKQPHLIMTTGDAKEITDSSATLYLSVGGEDAAQADRFGFYYHTSSNVKQGKRVAATLDQGASYKAHIAELESNRYHYYLAYGVVGSDTVYGELRTFKTLKKPEVAPDPVLIVITLEPDNITDSSATLYLAESVKKAEELGFFYHTQADVKKGKSIAATHSKDSTYTAAIKGLEAERLYFYKAFGLQTKNGKTDTIWGEVVSFTTLPKVTTAVEAALVAGGLKVYPNPVAKDGELTVELPLEAGVNASANSTATYVLTIANLSGKTVQTLPMNQRQTIVRGLESGVYLLQVESRKSGIESTKVYRAKVVVQ